jgi:hypothetical protein
MGAVSQVVALQRTDLEALTPVATFSSPLAEPVLLFRVPDPLPRCYLVSSSVIADGAEAVQLITDPSFDPRTQVLLPSGSPSSPVPGFQGTCAIRELVSDRVRVQASLNGPGYLVLVDTYDPGWRASVGGRPAPLLRANLAFRGVALPPGTHEVEFLYRPWMIGLGLALSIGSFVLSGVAFLGRKAT